MDNEDEPHSRVNVQSIRERFEGRQTMTKAPVNGSAASVDQQLTVTSLPPEVDTARAGSSSGSGNSSNSSESDRSPTGFQLHLNNRVSIKRSPAFRTGSNKTSGSSSLSPELLASPNINNNNNNNNIQFDSSKRPATALKRKPGVDRSTKPNHIGSPSSSPDNMSSLSPAFNSFLSNNAESDAKLEEALKAPLPTGPAPKKPPRTFQHDVIILQQQNRVAEMVTSDESSGSPQRPARRKTPQLMRSDKPPHFSQPRPVTIAGIPYTLSRSKTESFLLAAKKQNELKSDSFLFGTEDDVDAAPMSTPDVIRDSRWLNPVQWNNYSPRRTALSPPSTKPLGYARVSSSMLSISDQNARKNVNCQGKLPMDKQPTLSYESPSTRRMSCDFVGGRRRFEQPANSEFTFQSTNGFHSRKGPLASAVSLGHIYDQPSTEGDLHYMCSPIMEVGARNGPWNNEQQRMTDDSDCESENDFKKSQIVEDRKIYVRRVSSNVCDLRKAARPFSTTKNAVEPGAGLLETFLVVALYYDRQLQQHTPYIKSSYPSHTVVPPGVEHFCFPDSTHWPPPLQTASEPYTIVLTDSKGERLYGYCRRVVPEGAQTCIPITYCLLSRHRSVGFYTKVLNMMVSRHGIAESQRMVLLDSLHKQPFPNPGRFVEFPSEASTGGPNRVSNKVQRLLDGRLEDIDLRVLFEQLNETVVLHVLGTVLLERKLIFVSQNLGVLSLCIDAVQSMLYPFVWQHTLVPVLPQSMTEISSAPTPFILGILSKNVDDWKSIYPDQGMLVDLDSGKVLHCVGDESTILPRRSIRKLCSDWEVTVNITQQAETARNALYSESFLRMFVDLCGHYEQHINIGDSGEKFFERSTFIQSHSNSSARDFLEWFTETALFTLFIESRLKPDAAPTLFEHKILEHSMHIVRPNAQLILPNSKILGRKIKTLGDKLREMNVFS